MIEEYEKGKKKRVSLMRSIADYVMGGFFAVLGIFFFFRSSFKLDFNERFPPDAVDKIFGAICLLYGSWRIYRGVKKNYFK